MRCETETGIPSPLNAASTRRSVSGWANANSSETATARAPLPRIAAASSCNSPSPGARSTSPSALTRSAIPNRIPLGTRQTGAPANQSYKSPRVCRPIAIVSSNPAVVTKATRDPRLSSIAFVPIVVPCRTSTDPCAPMRPRASRTETEGSEGVEKTFRTRSSPPSR